MPNPFLRQIAGRLRNPVQIQSQSSTNDQFGQPVASAVIVGNAWASIEKLTGRELFQANQFTAQVTHLITIRWTTKFTVQGGMYIVFATPFETHRYRIQSVDNCDQRNIVIAMDCLEINVVE